MKVRADSEGHVASAHLPPIEATSLLTLDSRKKVQVKEKIDMPVDAFGVPDPIGYLSVLTSTLDPSYVLPQSKNVHHLAYPRALYHEEGRGSVRYRYRETPALMIQIQTQLHNYGHKAMLDPRIPSDEVMHYRVREQNDIDTLFKIGQSALLSPRWLNTMQDEGVQQYQQAERYVEKHLSEATFYDYLATCDDPLVGLLPPKEELIRLGLREATRKLGVLSAARAVRLHRTSQAMVRRAA